MSKINSIINTSIDLLNRGVAEELSTMHQYMYFHFHSENKNFDLLAMLFKRAAFEEMKYIELMIDRILFLNGDVVMKSARAVNPLNSITEMLEYSRRKVTEIANLYNEWANICALNSDPITQNIFENLVANKAKHFEQYDFDLVKVDKFGNNHPSLQSVKSSVDIFSE
jgi:bacterioferritin